ncbi:hypothetical protein [Hyphomicrobium sp. 99]|uniref:argonaute/piwi family protein n=1 Tax=Hyphomicrobium sp. 99 TaxID=1163419 RepID=UPI0005F78315|nr:hypothetical protein [Hyphomicrobium sp. 99]
MQHLTINFAPISLAGATKVQVGRQDYDHDRLRELRQEFAATHVLMRRREGDVIVDIPVVHGQKPIGNVIEELDLSQERWLWPALFEAALIRAFHNVREILPGRGVTVLGKRDRGLLIHSRLPASIQRRHALHFGTRSMYAGGERSVGLVCELSLKNLIRMSCAELIGFDVPIEGHYVLVEEPAPDPRILPRRKLAGRVTSIADGMLVLDDHAEGFEVVAADRAFLEPRVETVDDCVRRMIGVDAPLLLADAERAAVHLNSGPGRKEKIDEAMSYLRDKADLNAIPGARFVIDEMLTSDRPGFPIREMIEKPVLVFDPSGTRKDDWSERGLKQNGPYDQRVFSPKRLRIAVICQARHEGQVDAFLAKFLEGMPDVVSGRKKVARYGDGFIRRFALQNPEVAFFTAPTAIAADYVQASHRALSAATDGGFSWDLALVQVEEEFKSYDDGSNPYFATKSVFLKRGVAVQSIRLETMAQPDSQLVFSLNHMSLATYAKLGGTPWLLASQQTVAHELVIGLGSHSVASSRVGAHERYVGITTVFSSDGSYLLSDRTAVVPFQGYASALYEALKRSITTVRKQDNWRSTDKVRLVFHVFMPLKDAEAEAIERTVLDLHLDNVTFAFLHIAPKHPFLVFDHGQSGIGFSEPKKGVLGPARGLHLKLSDYESLVVFAGASELKLAEHGMPRPCLLKLHRLSTFTDMTYLARQAFQFSGHSWRMLAPERYPITIRYSDLIAERLSGLSAVDGWDTEAVHFGPIGRTLWFL